MRFRWHDSGGGDEEYPLILHFWIESAAGGPLPVGSAKLEPEVEMVLDASYDRPLIRRRARASLERWIADSGAAATS